MILNNTTGIGGDGYGSGVYLGSSDATLIGNTIANNIANLETSGYHRIDVRFEELLAKALQSSGRVDLQEVKPEIYQPNKTPVKSNGNDVNLETEIGQMVKNSLLHKAYIRLLNKKYRQIEIAIDVSGK